MLQHMWIYYALLSALFAALTAIFSKMGVKTIDSNLATAIRTTFILILVWSVSIFNNTLKTLADIPKFGWIWLFLSAVATGLSWLCYFKALELGEVSKVAPIDKLSVPITIILAFFFLSEKITWQIAAGGALITAGAIILAL